MNFLLLLALGALPATTSGNSIRSKTSNGKSSHVCRALQDKYLLAHIFEFGKCGNLSATNKFSREVLIEMQIKMLVDITGYEPFVNMEAGDELNMLLAVCERMEGRLSDIFVFASAFYPRSPLTVDFAVMTVMNDQSRTAEDKKSYFTWLAKCLVGDSNVLALARLLEIVPDDLFSNDYFYNVSPRTYHKLAAVNQDMARKLLKLNPSYLGSDLLSSILLAEIPFDDFTSFFDPNLAQQLYLYNNGTPFRAIIKLCTSNFSRPSAEKCARILQQNIKLMKWAEGIVVNNISSIIRLRLAMDQMYPGFQKVSSDIDFDKSLALLLNKMRFAPMSDAALRVEILTFLKSDNNAYKNDKTHRNFLDMHLQRPALFKEILKHARSTPTRLLQEAILQHPSFATALSADEYRQLTYRHSPLTVVRFEKVKNCSRQTWKKTLQIADVALRLAVIAEVHPGRFKEAVEGIAESGPHCTLLASITLLLREFDQPAPYVDIIWSHIDVECEETGRWLTKVETLRLLLLRENCADFLLQATQKVGLLPEPFFFRALLEEPDLAKAVLSDKCSMIVRSFIMDIQEIVEYYNMIFNMIWHKMSTLFDILQIPINQSFDGTVTEDTLTEFKNWLSTATIGEMAERATAPEFLPHLACVLADLDCKNDNFQESVESGKPNLLLLRFFFLYELWFSTARTHFEAYAPLLVRRAFIQCSEASV